MDNVSAAANVELPVSICTYFGFEFDIDSATGAVLGSEDEINEAGLIDLKEAHQLLAMSFTPAEVSSLNLLLAAGPGGVSR